jgi:hypothetical protein
MFGSTSVQVSNSATIRLVTALDVISEAFRSVPVLLQQYPAIGIYRSRVFT